MNVAFGNCKLSFCFKNNGLEASGFYQSDKDFDHSRSVSLPKFHRAEVLYCVSTTCFSLNKLYKISADYLLLFYCDGKNNTLKKIVLLSNIDN
jgi:hypothetical protein